MAAKSRQRHLMFQNMLPLNVAMMHHFPLPLNVTTLPFNIAISKFMLQMVLGKY
jgi:hypothetical protein